MGIRQRAWSSSLARCWRSNPAHKPSWLPHAQDARQHAAAQSWTIAILREIASPFVHHPEPGQQPARRLGIWHLVSNRNYTALEAKREYERRWGCECGFRVAKHLLGLKDAEIKDPVAYAQMFTLVTIALLLLAIIGCAFLAKDPQAGKRVRSVCADRGTHCESNLFDAVLHLLKHISELWDYLVPEAKLDLNVSLQNVS